MLFKALGSVSMRCSYLCYKHHVCLIVHIQPIRPFLDILGGQEWGDHPDAPSRSTRDSIVRSNDSKRLGIGYV